MNRLNPLTIVMGSLVLASALLFMRPNRGVSRMMGWTWGRVMARRMMRRLQLA